MLNFGINLGDQGEFVKIFFPELSLLRINIKKYSEVPSSLFESDQKRVHPGNFASSQYLQKHSRIYLFGPNCYVPGETRENAAKNKVNFNAWPFYYCFSLGNAAQINHFEIKQLPFG
jgi:hypothetical protein